MIEVPADKINLEFVLGNKVMVGTVNANREYFEMGVKDLAQAEAEYPGWLSRLLTHPVKGLENYRELFDKLLNPNGAITGWYVDDADANHGFVRDKHCAIVEFDVPGAGTGPGQGPYPFSIAPNGAVTGFSYDANNVVHGFVREAHRQ